MPRRKATVLSGSLGAYGRRIAPCLVASLLATVSVRAQDAVVPGELTSPYPTLIHLSIQWLIKGDANANAAAAVEFRAQGESAWRTGMPLRRVAADSNEGFSWPDKLAGSLFGLKPDTPYEIRIALTDPEGGGETRSLTARTRPAPEIPPGAVIVDLPAGNHGVLKPVSGTAESPRVYRSSDRSAEGAAVYDFVDLTGQKFVWLWGLTIRSSGANNRAGVKMNGSEGIVIRYCTVAAQYGIVAYDPGTTDSYFGDNVVTGQVAWADSTMGADGDNEGEGIQITGPGNVIAYNQVGHFRDAVSLMEEAGAINQVSEDIYGNDINVGADDAIEADFCAGNCRIEGNRIVNSFVGVSSQPGLGGPTYILRNAMYNVVHAAFKLKRFSQGDVVLHNTVVKVGAGLGGNEAMDWAYFRNNLAFGGPDGGVDWGGYGAGNPYAADVPSPGSHSSFDYDAVGVTGTKYVAKIGGQDFATVEAHGLANLDFASVFPGMAFPDPPVPERAWADLRPAAGSRPVDAALRIPNINDGFSGAAPDIGAFEAGQSLPHYGPRPQGSAEAAPGAAIPMRPPRPPALLPQRVAGGYLIRFGTAGQTERVDVLDLRGSVLGRFEGAASVLIPDGSLSRGVSFLRYQGSLIPLVKAD
jgi:hypothetical protein